MAACILCMLTLVMVSCGPDKAHYALDGHLLNMNQGEFLIYSPDGAINRVDTAYVEGGRFEVEEQCEREGTLIIIMPNGAEIPVFIEPGGSVSLEGNAQDLKNIEIKGLEANGLMSKFRKETANATRGQIIDKVGSFVEENPQSVVCTYLIRHYLLNDEKPDYAKALKLIGIMRKADQDNEPLKMFELSVKDLQNTDVGASLPDMNLTDIDGNSVSNASLHSGITIFTTIVSYDYESTSKMRRIKDKMKEFNKPAKIVVISIDASKEQFKRMIDMDKSDVIAICDEKMTESEAAQKLMAGQIGTVVIAKDGKIVQRNLSGEPLYNYLKSL